MKASSFSNVLKIKLNMKQNNNNDYKRRALQQTAIEIKAKKKETIDECFVYITADAKSKHAHIE